MSENSFVDMYDLQRRPAKNALFLPFDYSLNRLSCNEQSILNSSQYYQTAIMALSLLIRQISPLFTFHLPNFLTHHFAHSDFFFSVYSVFDINTGLSTSLKWSTYHTTNLHSLCRLKNHKNNIAQSEKRRLVLSNADQVNNIDFFEYPFDIFWQKMYYPPNLL